jgi:hypothetical protein
MIKKNVFFLSSRVIRGSVVGSARGAWSGARGARWERAPKIPERAPERGAPEIPGSVLTRSGARSGILGARSHLRSLDAPAQSALQNFGSALPPALLGRSRSERAPGLRCGGGGGPLPVTLAGAGCLCHGPSRYQHHPWS